MRRTLRAHLHLLSVLQLTWGGIMLMLGVSTALLALGAAAAGWTSAGAEISAAVTSLAFAVFAAALLAGGAANSWAGRALHRLDASRPDGHARSGRSEPVRPPVRDRARHLRVLGAPPQRNADVLRSFMSPRLWAGAVQAYD